MRRPFIRITLIFFVLSMLVSACTPAPESTADNAKPTLKIGYLPITHAALPLIVYAQNNEGQLEHFNLEMVRFSNWAELAEAAQSEKIDGGGDILNNLTIKIAANGTPLTVILMAVHDGSAFIVSNEIQTPADLVGKRIAIPSRFSPHFILLYKYLQSQGLNPDADVEMVDMAPPDMVQALSTGDIGGYIVAEPFGAQAEEMGIGRVMVLSKDINVPGLRRNECAIAINRKFIEAYPEATQEFVDRLIQAGIWTEENPQEAAELVSSFLNQKPATILHAMNQPEGRTRYIDLFPRVEEYAAFQNYMIELGLLETGIDMDVFVDESFAEKAYEKFGLEKQEW